MKFYSLALIVLGTISSAALSDELKIKSFPQKKVISEADKNPIQGPKLNNVYGTGMIYARPTRGTPGSGIIWKSDELHLIVGNFQDDTKYSGNTVNASTKDRALLTKIDNLDQETHYIFKFWYSYPFHFNMLDTSTIITDIQESYTPANFVQSGLPTEFDVAGGRVGHQAGPAVTNGRLVEVLRWKTYFLNRPICTFVLDQGGSRRSAEKTVANEVSFNIYSEEGCKYVEDILPYGLELKVNYTQAYLQMDGNDHTAHSIEVDRIPGMKKPSSISGEILNDPDFQKGMIKLIEDFWALHHPESKKQN